LGRGGPTTCGKCHTQNNIPAEFKMKYPNVATQFQESIHGKALLQLGLIVAPSCDDCHGVHNIRRAVDAASPISHANVAKTCGKCHVTVEATYDKSIHGQLLAKGDPRAPNCIDCHSAHQIVNPNVKNFKEQSDITCGKCHQDRLEHYRETYHGKAMALGQVNSTAEVAACYDCHGNHDVLPPSDPASRLSQANIVHTCQSDGREALPLPAPHLRGDDGPADRGVLPLRRPHAAVALPVRLSLLA
jgi:hypothetical protein